MLIAWCFADYDRRLWSRPPCDFVIHERSFGLFRADGSLKPMGKSVADFAKSKPKVQSPEKTVTLPVSNDEYYRDPSRFLRPLYEEFGAL